MGWNIRKLLVEALPAIGGALFGPVGAAGGTVISGLVGTGESSGKANDAAAGGGKIANTMAGQYTAAAPSLGNAMLTESGIDPTTHTYNPNYNPMQAVNDSLYGGTQIQDRANTLFDPAYLQNEMARYKSTIAPQYDNAVGAARADATNRGFAGTDTALDSSLAAIRRSEAAEQSGFNTNLMTNLYNAKRGYTVGQQQAGQGLLAQGASDAQRNLFATQGLLTGSAQGAAGTFGGLQGFYQDNANRGSANTSAAIGQIAKSGGFSTDGFFGKGGIFGRPGGQSTSPGTTNSQSGSPMLDVNTPERLIA